MPRLRAISVLCALLATACGADAEDEPAPRWRSVLEGLPGALISVSGTSERDVWAVGGNPEDGSGAFVLHFDGERWKRHSTGANVDLWWVHAFASGPVYFGGGAGTILRYDGNTFTQLATPTKATVFGIWGASADDVWAVGGEPTQPGSAFVWHFDGQTWSAPAGFPNIPIASWFKVWGRGESDVRFVGMDGAVVHFDGVSFTQPAPATNRRLLTVHAEPGERWTAVGGSSSAVILEDDGSGWVDVSPPTPSQAMIGVRSSGSEAYAAGTGGALMRRVGGSWRVEPVGFDVFSDFHSVWIDPTGGVWVAGGSILAFPLVDGVLLHKGTKPPPSSYE